MLKGVIAVFLGAVSYGILSTIAKMSYDKGYDANHATLFQVVFGFALLLLISLFQKHKFQFNQVSNKDWLNLLFGGLTIALTSLFYYSCVQYVPASIGIILLFQFVWMGFLLDFLFNKEKPSRLQLLALVVLLSGTFLASGGINAFRDGLLNAEGVILGLLAALCYASYIFINGRLKVKITPISKSMVMMGVSSIVVLILLGNKLNDSSFINMEFLAYGIPLALFGAVIPPILFAYGVPKIGVTYSSILSSVELPVAVLFSIAMLNEQVSSIQWLGISLIIIAILGVTFFKK